MKVFQVRRRSAAGGARVAALSAKRISFLEVCIYFRSAGTLVWNTMGTTLKHEVIVHIFCSVNYEIKNI